MFSTPTRPLGSFWYATVTPSSAPVHLRGFDSTTTSYRRSLVHLAANGLALDDRDLDTGKPTRAGEYKLADAAYTRMLHALAGKKFADVSPALRLNIVAFFRDTTMRVGTKKDSAAWNHTLADLAGLRSAAIVSRPAGAR